MTKTEEQLRAFCEDKTATQLEIPYNRFHLKKDDCLIVLKSEFLVAGKAYVLLYCGNLYAAHLAWQIEKMERLAIYLPCTGKFYEVCYHLNDQIESSGSIESVAAEYSSKVIQQIMTFAATQYNSLENSKLESSAKTKIETTYSREVKADFLARRTYFTGVDVTIPWNSPFHAKDTFLEYLINPEAAIDQAFHLLWPTMSDAAFETLALQHQGEACLAEVESNQSHPWHLERKIIESFEEQVSVLVTAECHLWRSPDTKVIESFKYEARELKRANFSDFHIPAKDRKRILSALGDERGSIEFSYASILKIEFRNKTLYQRE